MVVIRDSSSDRWERLVGIYGNSIEAEAVKHETELADPGDPVCVVPLEVSFPEDIV